MDAKQIAERQIVARYLANSLSEEEAGRFEAYIEEHPEVTREIELVARMKSGLATLHERGDLSKIVAKPASTAFKRLTVIAASVVAVGLATIFLVRQPVSGESPLQASLTQDLTVSSRLILTRTRGESPPQLARRGDARAAAEFAFEPGAPGPARSYSVSLFRLEGSRTSPVGQPQQLKVSGDGKLRFYVRLEPLIPGDYLVRLSLDNGQPEEFLFTVAP